MNKYVIVEVIPEAISPSKGNLVQLSALKIDDLQLQDRFDYRINEDKIYNKDLIDMCSYDKDKFNYLNSTNEILDTFNNWIEDYPLLIIDNNYTRNYLEKITNNKKSIFDLLNIINDDQAINNIIKKYNLQPSNYITDLLYEALIYESNNKK